MREITVVPEVESPVFPVTLTVDQVIKLQAAFQLLQQSDIFNAKEEAKAIGEILRQV